MTRELSPWPPGRVPDWLETALEGFAGDVGRALSRRARVRIDVSLTGIHGACTGDLASRLGPFDRAVALELATEGPVAFVLVPWALAFDLLTLRFGGGHGADPGSGPERPYTRIEARALERTAQELWTALAGAACGALPAAPRVAGLEDAVRLRTRRDGPLWLAHLALHGAGPAGEILFAVPGVAWGASGGVSDPAWGEHEDAQAGGVDAEGASAPRGGAGDAEAPAAAPGLTLRPPPDLRPPRGASGAHTGPDGSRAG